MRAALFSHPEVVTRLAKAGADLNYSVDRRTALHLAASSAMWRSSEGFAAANANLNVRQDASASTPLMSAVLNGQADAVQALVDAGADTNVGGENDTSLLVMAVETGRLAVVRELVRGRARVNDRLGSRWQPPLHAALPTAASFATAAVGMTTTTSNCSRCW